MLLHHLAASMSSRAAGSVTQPSAPTRSATPCQSSALGPHSVPSPGTDPWYLDSGASFHMTPHSTHLSALRPSYHHCTVHTAEGSPLSVARQGTLCSNSFHVRGVSLVLDLSMQLMSAGQITNHDCHVILDPDFCYIYDSPMGHLVGTGPGTVTHIVFRSLTSFVFPPLRPLVLPVLLSLLHTCHRFISGIIVWVIFVDLDYLLCFVDIF
jgi:hypothetical protein